jgi:hypothetical protein
MARLLVQRQLGHKPEKHVHAFELMDSFAGPGLGKGSYRADRGYEWQAGICSKGCTPP